MSGPARPAPAPPQRSAAPERGLVLGLLEALTGLSRHQALDRLIRGRTWIALIAFALIGIVTLQLLVLTLNARIGRTLVHEAQLQRENAALSIESSELTSGERVESLAARLGMELVQVGDVRFLSARARGDIARAAAALSDPARAPGAGAAEAGAGSSAEAGAASGEQASTASTSEAGTGATGEAGTPASAGAAEASTTTTAGAATQAPSGAAAEQPASATTTSTPTGAMGRGEAVAGGTGEAPPGATAEGAASETGASAPAEG